jgi:hypothetical protein
MKRTDVIKKDLRKIRTNLKKFATGKRAYCARTLECMCGISGLLTFRYLKSIGLRPTFHENDIHCFVTCNIDNAKYYIDLTMKQFHSRYPAIYLDTKPVRNVPKWVDYINPHQVIESAKTETKIKKIFKRWPAEQNPYLLDRLPFL